MKIISKKDIIIPKGTIFENIDNTKRQFIYGNYDVIIDLDQDSCIELIVEENKEYFEVID